MEWTVFAIMVILIGYLLNVLKYILGTLLGDPSLKIQSLDGIFNLIVVMVLYFVAVSFPNLSDNIDSAQDLFSSIIDDSLYCQMSSAKAMIYVKSMSATGIYINPNVFTTGGKSVDQNKGDSKSNSGNSEGASTSKSKGSLGSPLSGYLSASIVVGPLIDMIGNLTSVVNLPYSFGYFQLKLLDLFSKIGLTVLFPVGIAFRAFSATKGAGNILISLFMGYYVFMPLLIHLEATLVYSLYFSDYSRFDYEKVISYSAVREICQYLEDGSSEIESTSFGNYVMSFMDKIVPDWASMESVCGYVYNGDNWGLYIHACRSGVADPKFLIMPILLTGIGPTLGLQPYNDIMDLYSSEDLDDSSAGTIFYGILKSTAIGLGRMDSLEKPAHKSPMALSIIRMVLESMILPLINVIFALGFAGAFGKLLGSNIDLSMLVRVV